MSDVRVVKRGEHLRFAAEPREAIGIIGDGREQHFDRDVAIQLCIACAIHLPHATCAEGGEDLVRAEAAASGERHRYFVGTLAFSSSNQPIRVAKRFVELEVL